VDINTEAGTVDFFVDGAKQVWIDCAQPHIIADAIGFGRDGWHGE
jgi:hypothetical protein